MKRKLMGFCAAVIVASVSLTVLLGNKTENGGLSDISYAERQQYYDEAADMNTVRDEAADMNNSTTQSKVDNYIEDKTNAVSNSGSLIGGFGGFGGIIGDVGDIIGSIIGGEPGENTQNSTPVATYPVSTNNVGFIDPVPAVTYIQGQTNAPVASATTPPAVSTSPHSETVNFAAASNPYKKPAGEIKPGDSGEGVKWMQWMFIYTNYGLTGKPITGVYDAETQALVKKLQQEKGLASDGIVNDAVIDKIELLYYEHSVTATTAPPAVILTAPETIGVTSPVADSGEKNSTLGIVIIILAAIWCVAIIAIIIIFMLKKKKKKNAVEDKTEVSETQTVPETTETVEKKDMSLSDLFEEANK